MNDQFIPVKISTKAIKEVKLIMVTKGIPEDYGLRIGVNGAGCAGISYLVGFDKRKESDITFLNEDVTIMIEKKHVMYLVGVELDFYEDTETRGFTFKNSGEKNE